MPQRERMRVWRGELRKTAGGLTKNDLVKNARGKIVSRKKSRGATNENNLGKWLRGAGDSFGGKLQDAGLPMPKPKGQGKLKKQVKAPRPQVDRKIKKPAAPKPKPKAKPKPKPKAKAKAKKKFAKPAALKPRSPVKAGQIKDLSKISVGNILVKKKVDTTGWPGWAKKATTNEQKWIEKEVKKEGGIAEMDEEDWDYILENFKSL